MADTLSMPSKTAPAKEETERMVSVKLLHDVWIPNAAETGGSMRIRTNIPVLDDEGNPKIDRKSKSAVTTHTVAELPISIAKQMIDEGKALRMDPL